MNLPTDISGKEKLDTKVQYDNIVKASNKENISKPLIEPILTIVWTEDEVERMNTIENLQYAMVDSLLMRKLCTLAMAWISFPDLKPTYFVKESIFSNLASAVGNLFILIWLLSIRLDQVVLGLRTLEWRKLKVHYDMLPKYWKKAGEETNKEATEVPVPLIRFGRQFMKWHPTNKRFPRKTHNDKEDIKSGNTEEGISTDNALRPCKKIVKTLKLYNKTVRRMSDASENRGKNFKSWRCRDFSTYIYCSQKFNKYGRFLSIITVKGYNRVVIIIPESSYNGGWGLVATKIEEFITEKTSTPGAVITNGGTTEHLLNEKGSFKDALNKNKWTLKEAEVTEVDVVKNQLSVKTQEADNDLLRRCLVGRSMVGMKFRLAMRAPFQSKPSLIGFGSEYMVFLYTSGPQVIGDKCGGWLENEETELKNHLRWARIRVKGPRETIPLSIDVDDGNLIFSMPIWVKSPVTYKKKEIVTNPRQVTIACKGEPRVVLGCGYFRAVACSSAECLNLQESVGHDPILLNSTLPPDMDQPESPFGPIHLTPRPKPTSEPFIEPVGSQEPYKEEDWPLFQKSTDKMSFVIKKSNGFTKPFTNSILMESGKLEKIFEHSSIDEDTEFYMRMETTPKNFQSLSIDNLQIKESKETSDLVSRQMDSIKGIDSEGEESVIELFGEQMVEYEDPKPLAMDDSIVEDCIESQATLRFQLNLLKLSRLFGVSTKGYEKEFYSLIMKLEQNKPRENQKSKDSSSSSNNNSVPKELRNLIFNMNFKDGQNQNLTWYLTAVYVKCKRMEKKDLWCELEAMRSLYEGPWVVCGDFNVIRYPSERTNCSSINGAMSEFYDCIEEVELIDPHLFGGSFTWRRRENHTTASRIDRIMYSAQWEEFFTLIRQSTLPKLVSDHNPVLLTCGDMNFKKSYFKFENWWMVVEGIKEKVSFWWSSFVVTGTAGFVLAEKLKLLKRKLEEWSKNNRSNWKQQKEEILDKLSKWEILQE
ncbi:hypothetical protein MTR67_026515 [Solanum verrucosum]|uniref:Endonuclease/exonuclease/phosphatase domain-containing protein n=1 Tax=Solanum verrucosum TaxID=315347 RepID=A0AAF0TZ83_SOLVR|nr:hypothetical protein MTR67_026515 [Solanum verrucosum]